MIAPVNLNCFEFEGIIIPQRREKLQTHVQKRDKKEDAFSENSKRKCFVLLTLNEIGWVEIAHCYARSFDVRGSLGEFSWSSLISNSFSHMREEGRL